MLCAQLSLLELAPGQVIVEEREQGHSAYIVLEGAATVYCDNASSHRDPGVTLRLTDTIQRAFGCSSALIAQLRTRERETEAAPSTPARAAQPPLATPRGRSNSTDMSGQCRGASLSTTSRSALTGLLSAAVAEVQRMLALSRFVRQGAGEDVDASAAVTIEDMQLAAERALHALRAALGALEVASEQDSREACVSEEALMLRARGTEVEALCVAVAAQAPKLGVRVGEKQVGEILGEVAMCSGGQHMATVIASTEHRRTVVAGIARDAFLRCFRADEERKLLPKQQLLVIPPGMKHLPSLSCQRLAYCSRWQSHPFGSVIFRAGDQPTHVYVVKSGAVRLVAHEAMHDGEWGDAPGLMSARRSALESPRTVHVRDVKRRQVRTRPMHVAMVGAGELLGAEPLVFGQLACGLDAVAEEGVELLAIPAHDFELHVLGHARTLATQKATMLERAIRWFRHRVHDDGALQEPAVSLCSHAQVQPTPPRTADLLGAVSGSPNASAGGLMWMAAVVQQALAAKAQLRELEKQKAAASADAKRAARSPERRPPAVPKLPPLPLGGAVGMESPKQSVRARSLSPLRTQRTAAHTARAAAGRMTAREVNWDAFRHGDFLRGLHEENESKLQQFGTVRMDLEERRLMHEMVRHGFPPDFMRSRMGRVKLDLASLQLDALLSPRPLVPKRRRRRRRTGADTSKSATMALADKLTPLRERTKQWEDVIHDKPIEGFFYKSDLVGGPGADSEGSDDMM